MLYIHPDLEIRNAGTKGRGVFASAAITADTCIEISPVIVLSAEERKHVEQTRLYDYIFAWGKGEDQAAVALGYLSIYNHAAPSNCEYVMDFDKDSIAIVTMRDIAAGEELTINYATDWHGQKPVWFETV